MGVHENVGFERWPAQGRWLHRRARVCFDYDTSQLIGATVVRDDAEEPHLMLLRLDDGRFVSSAECMWQPADGSDPPASSSPG